MKIMYMVLGHFMTNTYILYNEETMEGLVVDPSFSPEHYIKAINEKKIHLRSIFLTHGQCIGINQTTRLQRSLVPVSLGKIRCSLAR